MSGMESSVVERRETGFESVTDEALFARYCAGDTDAFSMLFHRYKRKVFVYLIGIVGSEADAEDVLQNVFIKVIRFRDQFEPGRRFSPWIFGIASHAAADFHRKKKHQKPTISLDQSNGESDDGDELSFAALVTARDEPRMENMELRMKTHASIMEVMRGLPKKMREIAFARFYHDFTYEEISHEFRMPMGTVRSYLFRVRQTIKFLFKEQGLEVNQFAA